jgi:hypothetical protein
MLGDKSDGSHSAAFTAFLLANAGIAVGGLFTVATGAFVMTEKGRFEWLSTCFIAMGLAMLTTATIAFQAKEKATLLQYHIFWSAALLALEVAFAYAVLGNERYDVLIDLPESQVFRFAPIVCCVLFLISFLAGWCHLHHLQSEKELRSPLRLSA